MTHRLSYILHLLISVCMQYVLCSTYYSLRPSQLQDVRQKCTVQCTASREFFSLRGRLFNKMPPCIIATLKYGKNCNVYFALLSFCVVFFQGLICRERKKRKFIYRTVQIYFCLLFVHFLSAVCAIRRELIIYMVAEMIWLYNIFNLQKNFQKSTSSQDTKISLTQNLSLSLYHHRWV